MRWANRAPPHACPSAVAHRSGRGRGRGGAIDGWSSSEEARQRRAAAVTRRTRRGVAGGVLVVLALVIGAVIATALHADGRERWKADTNHGGAWLLKRD